MSRSVEDSIRSIFPRARGWGVSARRYNKAAETAIGLAREKDKLLMALEAANESAARLRAQNENQAALLSAATNKLKKFARDRAPDGSFAKKQKAKK